MSQQMPPTVKPRTSFPLSPTKPPERTFSHRPPPLPPKTPPPLPPPLPPKTPTTPTTPKTPTTPTTPITPPPVYPKTKIVKMNSRQSSSDDVQTDGQSLPSFFKKTAGWNGICSELKQKGASSAESIQDKAEQLQKDVQRFIELMDEHGDTMKQYICDLYLIAENLDKVSKGTKIAGITGGATTVAGGVAAAAGIILSPFTLGASLALTAVGVGVAAAGGVTGASAAIAHKVNAVMDKKKLEKILQDYEHINESIQPCLMSIIEPLKQHGLPVLSKLRMDPEKATKMADLAATTGANGLPLDANLKTSGVIKGFALGMDMYFTQGKDGKKKVKKGLESKFAMKIRELAEDLEKALTELTNIKELCSMSY